MKLLLASFWQLPSVGGVWTYVEMLRRGLMQHGHQVDILTRHPDRPGYYLLGHDRFLPKEKLEPTVRANLMRSYRRQASRADLHTQFDRNGMTLLDMEVERSCFELAASYFGLQTYDLIHAQEVISARALSRVKPARIPLVATLHGVLTEELIKSGGFPHSSYAWRYSFAQEALGLRSVDRAIVPTQWLKDLFVRSFKAPEETLTVIPYGMDIDSFLQHMDHSPLLTAPPDKQVIMCPARLDLMKGQQHLLKALARLKTHRRDWVCWLVGEGYAESELQRQCEALGLEEDVLFLGKRDDVPALLKQATLVVLPSLQDNHPFAVMEGQTAGKLIIATTVGGLAEMITHNQSGLLVPPADSDALYRTILQALDPTEWRHRMEAAACQRARSQWSLHTMIERTLPLYENLTSEREEAAT